MIQLRGGRAALLCTCKEWLNRNKSKTNAIFLLRRTYSAVAQPILRLSVLSLVGQGRLRNSIYPLDLLLHLQPHTHTHTWCSQPSTNLQYSPAMEMWLLLHSPLSLFLLLPLLESVAHHPRSLSLYLSMIFCKHSSHMKSCPSRLSLPLRAVR